MTRAIKTSFCLFFFLAVSALRPQPQEASFRRYTAEDGLESSHITCLLQDHRGFLWVGTGNGLYRFEGYSFKAFKRNPADPASISDNSINALYEDRLHQLWIGTTNGLNAFNPHTEKFSYYRNTQEDADSTGRNFIASLSGDERGAIWVGTHGGGLYQFNRAQKKFKRVDLNLLNLYKADWLEISTILGDSAARDKIWLGTFKQGLLKLDPTSGSFSQYTHDPSDPQSLGSNNIISLYRDRRRTIWVGTHQGGLARVRDDDLTAVQFSPYHQDYFKTIGSIIEDTEGILWLGTSGAGLIAYDPATGRFKIFKSDPAHPRTLSDDWIMAQYIDRAGNLWIGTRSGLNKLQISQKKITHIKKTPEVSQSLIDNNVNAIYEDRQRRLWVGTAGGLSVFDAQSKLIANYKNDPKDTTSLSLNFVQVVGADKHGDIWVGTFGGGLNKLNPSTSSGQSRTFTRFREISGDTTSLTQNFVTTIYEDHAGDLWIGTLGGLNKFDHRRQRFTRYKSSSKNPRALNHNGITCMLDDRSRRLWIGTYGGGLNRLDRTTGEFTHYTSDRANSNSLSDNIVYCLFGDASGALWIGTNGGLNKFNPVTQQFTHYLEKDGLPNNAVLGILSDTDGKLWISTNNGLCKFDDRRPAGQKFVNFDARKDGLQADEFNQSAFHQNQYGELFFGGPNGLNRFYPQDLKPKTSAPAIVITAFNKFNRPVTLDTAVTETAEIKLSYQDSFFSLDFAALDFTLPEKNEYAYKLEGFNDDWIYCANQHTATFTNLNPGSYVFKVKGANSDGVWNETPPRGTLRITITPRYWQTWWFRLAMGGSILLLAYVFFRLRLAKAVALERLRVRIASDLHDDIGATLTKISLHSDLIQDGAGSPEALASLRKIGAMSRELVTTMSDIVWSIDARNDTAGNLIDHMRDFANSVCSPRQIEVQSETGGIDPNKKLPADVRQNLYLIFKEAVHNAAKYAEASQLFIKLQNLNGVFKMRIADDGKGFGTPRQSGHGLRNMQMRATRLGAKLDVRMENGVTVVLEGKAI